MNQPSLLDQLSGCSVGTAWLGFRCLLREFLSNAVKFVKQVLLVCTVVFLSGCYALSAAATVIAISAWVRGAPCAWQFEAGTWLFFSMTALALVVLLVRAACSRGQAELAKQTYRKVGLGGYARD